MNTRLSPGDGVVVSSLDNRGRAMFEDVQFSYPLKLIVPHRSFLPSVQCIYVLGYGGGLVAGDRVRLRVEARRGTTLVLLTQGSTKVFKTRPGRYLTNPSFLTPSSSTQQLYRLRVARLATLVLLPSPVTCFSRSRYEQRQAIHLEDESSSLILLDWYTSGRMGMDEKGKEEGEAKGKENWEFEKYRSENEVWIGGRRIAKDVLLLENETIPPAFDGSSSSASPLDPASPRPPPPTTTYAPRVAPYSCYASLFLFGPAVAPILSHLSASFATINHYKQRHPYSLVWSYSPLAGHPAGGGIARCAGDSTEAVKEWVEHVLGEGGIEGIISRDLWKTAFS